MSPSNLFLGRELRKKGILGSVFRVVDQKGMRQRARDELRALGISTLQDVTVPVENLSGGQRQAVAVARAAAFGSRVVVLDEPTAALGVRESDQVLELIRQLRERGIPVILISHNMPHVFDVADRIHVQRLGKRAGDHHAADAFDDRCGGDHDGRGDRVSGPREADASGAGRAAHRRVSPRRPGREEEVERLLLALADDVRREPGCLEFEPHRVVAPPRRRRRGARGPRRSARDSS